MANFPGPTYNRLIETDPQIVKISMDNVGWGARMSIFGKDAMGADPSGSENQKSGPPTAPEMTIKHTG